MSPRIIELTEDLHKNVQNLSDYLQANQLPQPSFDEDVVSDQPIESQDIRTAKTDAINACYELLDLLQGPKGLLTPAVSFIL